jgi:hypothetical protein
MRVATLLLAVLAGCASHSQLAPMGDGRFLLSKQASTGFPGLGNMKAELMQQAHDHCTGAGRQYELLSSTETQPPYMFGNYPRSEITFRCR